MRLRLLLCVALVLVTTPAAAEFTTYNENLPGGPNRVFATDVQIIANAAQGNGWISGAALTAQGSPTMSLSLTAGAAWNRRNGGSDLQVASATVVISTADANWPRIDLISIPYNSTTVVLTAGTPHAAPVPPDLPSVSSIPNTALWMVIVPAGATAITDALLMDKRASVDKLYTPVNAQTGTTYTVLSGDRNTIVTFDNTGAIAVTLPQAGVAFPSGWFADLQNRGTGTVTVTPTTSTIDGAATLVLMGGRSARIFSNGVHYYTPPGMAGGREVWAVVTADVTHAQSSTTLTDITGLSLAVCATTTEVWVLEIQLLTNAQNATADWKFGWSNTSTGGLYWGGSSNVGANDDWGAVGAASSQTPLLAVSATVSYGSAASVGGFRLFGTVVCTAASAGTLQMQFAQNTSNASNIIIKAGSTIFARKVLN